MKLSRRDLLKTGGATGAAMFVAGTTALRGTGFAAEAAPATSDVAFEGSSSSGTRRQTIHDVLVPFQSQIAADIVGKNIIIKPNGVWNTVLCTTHVDAIRGVLDFLRNTVGATQPIVIAEASAYAMGNGTSDVFTAAGYDALTSEYTDVTLLSFNDTTPELRHIWDIDLSSTQEIRVAAAFLDTDSYIISVARPKTHSSLTMTGTVKNMCMAMPFTADKPQMHGVANVDGTNPGENKCLSYNVYQLANLFMPLGQPSMAVLDAWEGMEGQGPISGTSVMQYCALASTDCLAVDRLCAKLMGFSDDASDTMDNANPRYTDMRYLVWMSNAGLGNYDLAKINILDGSLDDLTPYIHAYTLHTNYTGTPSYTTNWTGGPPADILDDTGLRESRLLDPKPFMTPQVRQATNGTVAITLSLPVNFHIRLSIHDLQGREVRRLGDEHLSSGRYTTTWDTRDQNGNLVPAGKYVIRMGFEGKVVSDGVMVVR